MVELIDILLVSLIVGAAILALARYFLNLGRANDEHSASCTGCTSCSDSSTTLLK